MSASVADTLPERVVSSLPLKLAGEATGAWLAKDQESEALAAKGLAAVSAMPAPAATRVRT